MIKLVFSQKITSWSRPAAHTQLTTFDVREFHTRLLPDDGDLSPGSIRGFFNQTWQEIGEISIEKCLNSQKEFATLGQGHSYPPYNVSTENRKYGLM